MVVYIQEYNHLHVGVFGVVVTQKELLEKTWSKHKFMTLYNIIHTVEHYHEVNVYCQFLFCVTWPSDNPNNWI